MIRKAEIPTPNESDYERKLNTLGKPYGVLSSYYDDEGYVDVGRGKDKAESAGKAVTDVKWHEYTVRDSDDDSIVCEGIVVNHRQGTNPRSRRVKIFERKT